MVLQEVILARELTSGVCMPREAKRLLYGVLNSGKRVDLDLVRGKEHFDCFKWAELGTEYEYWRLRGTRT